MLVFASMLYHFTAVRFWRLGRLKNLPNTCCVNARVSEEKTAFKTKNIVYKSIYCTASSISSSNQGMYRAKLNIKSHGKEYFNFQLSTLQSRVFLPPVHCGVTPCLGRVLVELVRNLAGDLLPLCDPPLLLRGLLHHHLAVDQLGALAAAVRVVAANVKVHLHCSMLHLKLFRRTC